MAENVHDRSQTAAAPISTEDRLQPGGAIKLLSRLLAVPAPHVRREIVYSALSSSISATRDRALDHRRSTERSEVARISAVSGVVKPAK